MNQKDLDELMRMVYSEGRAKASMGGIGNPFLFPDPDDDWYTEDASEDTITPQPIQPRQCEHKWTWYTGLAKAYYFCEKCGEEVDEI
jgi:hypothetical protein